MLFSDILGQQDAKIKLLEWYKQNRLPHALLIEGDAGYGTLPIALAFAQFLMCEDKQNLDSCNVCSQCIKVKELQHPDLHFAFPVVNKAGQNTSQDYMKDFVDFVKANPYGSYNEWMAFLGSEGKQGNINAEECKNIIDRLGLKTLENPLKILVLWLPEFLGKEGNRLLKLIEEPTNDTILLLVTEKPEELLPTIKSRLQSLRLMPISNDIMQQKLQTFPELSPQKIQEILYIADGNWNNVKSIMNNEQIDFITLFKSWLNVVYTKNFNLQSDWVENINELGRVEIRQFFSFCSSILRNTLHSIFDKSVLDKLSEEEATIIKVMLEKNIDEHKILNWLSAISEANYSIQRNVNIKLTLHVLSFKVQYLLVNYEFVKS